MADASIPVDLFNPGQVFACLGFMEAAEVLVGGAMAAFDWSGQGARFLLSAAGPEQPIQLVLDFLAGAEVVALAPSDTAALDAWNKTWGRAERLPVGAAFPFPDPPSPATLPALLRNGSRGLHFEHWGDQTLRDNVKFWAGAGDTHRPRKPRPRNCGRTHRSSRRWSRDPPGRFGRPLHRRQHRCLPPMRQPRRSPSRQRRRHRRRHQDRSR